MARTRGRFMLKLKTASHSADGTGIANDHFKNNTGDFVVAPLKANQKGVAAAKEAGFGTTVFGGGMESVNERQIRAGNPQFTLIWDTAADLDLHVLEPGGKHVYWDQSSGNFGGLLDIDNKKGGGPENILWSPNPFDPPKTVVGPYGEYKWFVFYYGSQNRTSQRTRWKVRVKYDDRVEIFEGTLQEIGEKSRVHLLKIEPTVNRPGGSPADDLIDRDVKSAIVSYRTKVEKLREELLKDYKDAELVAEKAKSQERLRTIRADREEFEAKGSPPTSLNNAQRYFRQLGSARFELGKSLSIARRQYEKSGNNRAAEPLREELKKLAEGENVSGVKAESKIEPVGEFQPRLTSPKVVSWTVNDPNSTWLVDNHNIDINREMIAINKENCLLTKKTDYRRSKIKVELAATQGTVAFVALRAQPGDSGIWANQLGGWRCPTSMIADKGDGIHAGTEDLDFKREGARTGVDKIFRYGVFFTLELSVDDGAVVRVGINGQDLGGMAHPLQNVADRGRLGIFVESGRVLVRSIVVTE